MVLASFPALLACTTSRTIDRDRLDKIHRLRRGLLMYSLLWLVVVPLAILELGS
jgi:hypothetical protein